MKAPDELRALVRQMKGLDRQVASAEMAIKVRNVQGDLIGSLTPVTPALANDETVVSGLTKWRRMFIRHFLTQFNANETRTRNWLRNVVLADDTRLLFLIYTDDHAMIGNFGVCNIRGGSAELDNLIRGEKGGDAHLIYFAELSLMDWLYSTCLVSEIYLHVFSNNTRTLALHSSVGFVRHAAYALTRHENGGEIHYRICNPVASGSDESVHLVKMHMSCETFYRKHSHLSRPNDG